MRQSGSEKLETIRLVELSELSVKATIRIALLILRDMHRAFSSWNRFIWVSWSANKRVDEQYVLFEHADEFHCGRGLFSNSPTPSKPRLLAGPQGPRISKPFVVCIHLVHRSADGLCHSGE